MTAVTTLAVNLFKQCFFIPPPKLTEKNIPDQTGKVFLITGANSGVGFQVCSILYSANGTVYLGCRSKDKADAAIATIRSKHPQSRGRLEFLHLNLSDLRTIKASVDNFLARESRLDWLNNNAGVMTTPRGSKGAQNFELQLQTNVMGPFLLTKLLQPVLKKTAASSTSSSVRVSWAGSATVDGSSPPGGMQFNVDATTGERSPIPEYRLKEMTYGATKAANLFLANEFARRGATRDGILHNAYNPGNLKTELLQHMSGVSWWGWIEAKLIDVILLHPAIFGAYTEISAGLDQGWTVEKDQGAYYVPWGRKATWLRPDIAANIGEGKGSEWLWEWCERETESYQ